MTEAEARRAIGAHVGGSASVHVVVTPLRRPWRWATAAMRTTQWLRDRPDVAFFLCGRSSAGGGVRDISRSLSPNRLVVVIEWAEAEAAATGRAAFDAAARAAGAAVWSATLVPLAAHGEWNGARPFRPAAGGRRHGEGTVVSLTCARLRGRRMIDFYVRSFPGLAKEARRVGSPMIAGLGFGGPVPLRDACTISFWPSSADVDAFAFRRSAHDAVQRRSVVEGWMSQSLFARFAVVEHDGVWAGHDPLVAATRAHPPRPS